MTLPACKSTIVVNSSLCRSSRVVNQKISIVNLSKLVQCFSRKRFIGKQSIFRIYNIRTDIVSLILVSCSSISYHDRRLLFSYSRVLFSYEQRTEQSSHRMVQRRIHLHSLGGETYFWFSSALT